MRVLSLQRPLKRYSARLARS